jgi:YD repeat-containing protein
MAWREGYMCAQRPLGSHFEAQRLVDRRRKRLLRRLTPYLALLLAGLALSQFLPALVLTAHADITYVYDTAGRLQYLIDASGHVVQYTYDADGNIQQVTTSQPSGVTVDSESPNNGPVGMGVTIFGTGFSTTPSQNSVSFHGTVATVTASSATTITTSVPTGATSGAVSVTSPSGMATGPTFTVH